MSLTTGGSFAAGTTQRWTVTVTDANASYRKGFQMAATGGTFAAVSNTLVSTGSNGRSYAAQFNVVVPAFADGDHRVTADVWGVAMPGSPYPAVGK